MSEIPAIDLCLGVKLANGSEDIALELLSVLVDTLPETQTQIETAYANRDQDALQYAVHQLHGAACYCGTPRLKAASQAMETAVKQHNDAEIQSHYQTLQTEIHAVIDAYGELSRG